MPNLPAYDTSPVYFSFPIYYCFCSEYAQVIQDVLAKQLRVEKKCIIVKSTMSVFKELESSMGNSKSSVPEGTENHHLYMHY